MSAVETLSPPLVGDQLDRIAADLQPTLLELIDLSLLAKQAHWNVTGPLFRPLHQQFDELAEATRTWSDDVAERLLAVGVPAEGRATSVAAGTRLEAVPAGRLDGRDAVRLVAERLAEVARRVTARVQRLEELDALSQDVLVEVGRGLEKQLWMLREQVA